VHSVSGRLGRCSIVVRASADITSACGIDVVCASTRR
jgi:hypothetical protein